MGIWEEEVITTECQGLFGGAVVEDGRVSKGKE